MWCWWAARCNSWADHEHHHKLLGVKGNPHPENPGVRQINTDVSRSDTALGTRGSALGTRHSDPAPGGWGKLTERGGWLTKRGRALLKAEAEVWHRYAAAVLSVLKAAEV